MILLRIAIGWHFLYEGVYKISTTPSHRDSFAGRILSRLLPTPYDKDKEIDPPFSAEGYLRNATGPLAPRFRGMLPDVNSLSKLERDPAGLPTRLKNGWKLEMARYANHFGFSDEQKASAQKELEAATTRIDDWFLKPDNAFSIKKYYRDLGNVLKVEQSSEALPYERVLAYKQRLEFDKERRSLVAQVDGFTNALRDSWAKTATKEQAKASGDLYAPWTQLDVINLTTMWGMVVVGLCLILGLFTPLVALGAAGFLTMFYLSMPPWPGLPLGKASEGHYLYVNKNLIEFMACLVVASTPSGLWLGLDAVLFGRKKKRDQETAPATVSIR